MSVSDRYWGFKLLLKDRQELDEKPRQEDFRGSSTARPLLSGLTSDHRFIGSNEDGNLIAEYGRFDLPEPDVRVSAVDEEPEAQMDSEPSEPQPDPTFVQPTEEELNRLTVLDLRRLRREIALQIHPDLRGSRAGRIDEDAMGRCNQLIDAAIKRKSSF